MITFFLGYKMFGGIQAGLIGFGLNVLACFLFSSKKPNT